jgi:hypothetical protein
VGKRSRKQRSTAVGARGAKAAPAAKKRRGPEPKPWPERPSVTRAKNAEATAKAERLKSRAERKNEEARGKLEPLEEGERPLAVTIGAVLAVALALANVVLYALGVEVAGQKPSISGIAGPTLILLVCGIGMWLRKYWAVLGMEALLGIIIVLFSLSAMTAENVKSVLIALAVIIPAGTLFWFLIRAMARIQMPQRPQRSS